MKKEIVLHEKNIEYILRLSKRAKIMRLAIYCDGAFIVTAPFGMRHKRIEQFIKKKSYWVIDKLEYFKKFSQKFFFKSDRRSIAEHKKMAFNLVKTRIDFYNKIYKFTFNSIKIKSQKTRWGSCSLKGNLNFNYKISLLPKEISDYIIVHELCHLGEFNHSRKFWNLVSIAIPNHLNLRRKLKERSINFY